MHHYTPDQTTSGDGSLCCGDFAGFPACISPAL
jgi:hypothetical protein